MMAKKVVVLLDVDDGRSLVRRKCRSVKLRIGTFEQLVDAELDQQGKQRKAGLWDEFDRILDEEYEESVTE
jgi:hypothetical protein